MRADTESHQYLFYFYRVFEFWPDALWILRKLKNYTCVFLLDPKILNCVYSKKSLNTFSCFRFHLSPELLIIKNPIFPILQNNNYWQQYKRFVIWILDFKNFHDEMQNRKKIYRKHECVVIAQYILLNYGYSDSFIDDMIMRAHLKGIFKTPTIVFKKLCRYLKANFRCSFLKIVLIKIIQWFVIFEHPPSTTSLTRQQS